MTHFSIDVRAADNDPAGRRWRALKFETVHWWTIVPSVTGDIRIRFHAAGEDEEREHTISRHEFMLGNFRISSLNAPQDK